MLEIPEAIVIAEQLNDTVRGKRIKDAIAAASPHKFAWYYGEPSEYGALLRGKSLENAYAYGGRIEIEAGEAALHFGDGAILRYYGEGSDIPSKHQLLITFDDGSALVGTIAMYGGLWAFPVGAMDDNMYYKAGKDAISPLSGEFDYEFFLALIDDKSVKMSAKAFLATKQRIPGLGNGVLQDILLNAKIHPKKKMNTLSDDGYREMYECVISTLTEMVDGGGRDTETDLFGNRGGYATKLSKRNALAICPNCGGAVKKENYMGGSIYYCESCQKL